MERILFPAFFMVVFCIATPFRGNGQNNDLDIFFDRPAAQWEETLPLGNGRLGMTSDGGIEEELIVLNDITLWSGAPQDANNYRAHKRLPEIRKLINEGKNDEAQTLIDKDFVCLGAGSTDVPFGCFQMLGNLRLKHRYAEGAAIADARDYERRLSLEKAVATTSYILNGVQYSREYFTSFAGDVCLIRLSADKPHSIHLELAIDRPERGHSEVIDDVLALSGILASGTAEEGMRYLAKVKPVLTDGTLRASANKLLIEDASEVVIIVSIGTDYKGADYRGDVDRLLNGALQKSYMAERKAHTERYQQLFNRLSINLGEGTAARFTTDKRLADFYAHPKEDPGLPALFFQFGRYLSISSTRVGLLPPNLQGLWANQIQTPWNGDYHLDVNVQMNHWPLEVANLSELNLPLADLVKGLVKPGERTAKAYYNADGWVAHVITNIWGFTEPGESASWGATKVGSGWLCNNLWEHYAFTKDTTYLAEIYPVMKGSAQFYNSMLVEDPKTGFLVSSPSSSPENTFYLPNGKTASICAGPTIDNQIIRELFTKVIEAAQTLRVDTAWVSELQHTLKRIPPIGQIASDGRLMEWMEDYKETDLQHRHISHLYGLYPATLITPIRTPELAEASKKSLEARGDDGPSWTIAYKLLFWARLLDGERSFKLLRELLKPTLRTDINYGSGGGVYPNMWSAGPPFQIDGNFGATAGIAEMLLQSHEDYIELLPAIPTVWEPFGEIKGMKARNNITVNMRWEDGKVNHYELLSPVSQQVKLKVNGEIKTVKTRFPHPSSSL
ncbi:glycoside hydrolase N-terminal domain-containing protein [Olivibacter sp. XZL3]|uniref:glycoside hydrolase family 95 protein n=1 Tax=Olivibacter sp. XZL3 TaxID=1735116 RepID=UPI001F0EBBC0|nr:glycoside hydrolase family 95 protein [Olivibacter sp. XZL3]